MRSFGHKCTCKALALACALVFSPVVVAGNGAGTVARLYKDFAWQALVSPGSAPEAVKVFGQAVSDRPRAVLNRYFDPSLARLLAKDNACVRKTREVCNLDFDPIFGSQDPAVTDLTIKAIRPGQVQVEFKYPSTEQLIRLDYRLRMVGGRWRIADIAYPTIGPRSLRAVLEGMPSK